MVYNKDKWIAAIKKSVEDLKTTTPTAGKPCAVASLRYLRDALLDDLVPKPEAGKQLSKADSELADDIKQSFSELIKAVCKDGAEDGFLSNASAAAKAAGFKSTTAVEAELSE